MGFIKNRSRILSSLSQWVTAIGITLGVFFQASEGYGAFASRFSLSAGEGYDDNIFFRKAKEHDFITTITPTLSLFYAPPAQTVPTLNLNIGTSGQVFANHSELNNIGDNVSVNGGYTYRYSPRLNFHISESFQRFGDTRIPGLPEDGLVQPPPTPTAPPPTGGTVPSPVDQRLKDFISRGSQITNHVSLHGSFLYRPDVSFTGSYANTYTSFLDIGGSDRFHTAGFRGVYNWRQDHNLHAGYSISFGRARNGDDSVIHTFDFGDDYFSGLTYQLTPTLSLSASTGISFNAGKDGPSVVNNSTATITKLWEAATLTGGVRKGLTPSFGVSGISDTVSFFTYFNVRLTERLSASATADFSLFNTEDVNFKTLGNSAGIQYLITSWLSSNLLYRFRWIDSGAGAVNTNLLDRGVVTGNSVFLYLTASFDLWPTVGLARSMTSPSLTPTPILRTPFPTPSVSSAPATP